MDGSDPLGKLQLAICSFGIIYGYFDGLLPSQKYHLLCHQKYHKYSIAEKLDKSIEMSILDSKHDKKIQNYHEMGEERGMEKTVMDIGKSAGPIVMALSLNRDKKTERIIIGQTDKVDAWLAGTDKLTAMYDVVRPLGTFLLEHQAQDRGEWSQNAGALLAEAASSLQNRKEKETAAWNYLSAKQNPEDMVCEFAVRQSWYWYQSLRTVLGSSEKSREYSDLFLFLVRSFRQSLWGKDGACSLDAAWNTVQREINGQVNTSIEQRMIIRYAARSRGEEWLLVSESFYPALQYYLRKLMDWGMCLCRCGVCNKVFIADSRHYSLCSQDCRRTQNRRNKQRFDKKGKENGYDQAYKNTCQRMRNGLKRIALPELYQEAEHWFQAFRKEATGRKKQIRDSEDTKAFMNWLFEREREFDRFSGK